MIGDIVGRPGRRAVRQLLPTLQQQYELELIIANGENAAGGRGLTQTTAEELFEAGVDVITSGNHIWEQTGIRAYLERDVPILRPLNYPPGAPGRGHLEMKDTLIINLSGRLFIANLDCPFRAIDELLSRIGPSPKIRIVDFHAEATSEKVVMGWYLDGRVSAVFGTHTHVPTADQRILPKGTAHITDVGMVGPWNSVIGMQVETVISRFITQLPDSLEVAKGPVAFNSVIVDIDPESGKTTQIFRLDKIIDG